MFSVWALFTLRWYYYFSFKSPASLLAFNSAILYSDNFLVRSIMATDESSVYVFLSFCWSCSICVLSFSTKSFLIWMLKFNYLRSLFSFSNSLFEFDISLIFNKIYSIRLAFTVGRILEFRSSMFLCINWDFSCIKKWALMISLYFSIDSSLRFIFSDWASLNSSIIWSYLLFTIS